MSWIIVNVILNFHDFAIFWCSFFVLCHFGSPSHVSSWQGSYSVIKCQIDKTMDINCHKQTDICSPIYWFTCHYYVFCLFFHAISCLFVYYLFYKFDTPFDYMTSECIEEIKKFMMISKRCTKFLIMLVWLLFEVNYIWMIMYLQFVCKVVKCGTVWNAGYSI